MSRHLLTTEELEAMSGAIQGNISEIGVVAPQHRLPSELEIQIMAQYALSAIGTYCSKPHASFDRLEDLISGRIAFPQTQEEAQDFYEEFGELYPILSNQNTSLLRAFQIWNSNVPVEQPEYAYTSQPPLDLAPNQKNIFGLAYQNIREQVMAQFGVEIQQDPFEATAAAAAAAAAEAASTYPGEAPSPSPSSPSHDSLTSGRQNEMQGGKRY